MSKSLVGLLSFAMVLPASTIVPTTAQARPGENRELQEYCYDLIASGDFPGLNLGECMSFNNNLDNPAGFKAHLCDAFREMGVLDEEGITYSECIRAS
jgi:hypothetical protein